MFPIEYRIENEDESVTLDFKKEVYGSEKKGEFLKDVAAFANALSNDLYRYIVIGVKDQNGIKEYFNVVRNDVGDVSNYQQLIDQNIEPNIPINIKYVKIEENELAVFVIGPCDNSPYVFKKDYLKNKQGIIYIRNGTSTRFAKRQELDLMYQRRQKVQRSDILVGFDELNESSIELRALDSKELKNSPSNKRKREIEHEINNRKSPSYTMSLKMLRDFDINTSLRIFDSEIPLTSADDSELQQMLLDVKDDYRNNDNYYYFEEVGNHFNLIILNQGSEPLNDCTIKLKVPIKGGVRIADDIYDNPADSSLLFRNSFESSQYPYVEKKDTTYIITENFKTIKHKLPTKVFQEDIRIVFPPSLEDTLLTIHYEIYADNYPDVISGDLTIKVVKNHNIVI
ncbi:helix-turn-helix domain-containing protein [Lysinibacillus xylanilyticus]|uniref:AlbA family DNA-binding domain-containing protein n=1 Tax=Lysinibacillus xylanilyticus TaxID=582475 RepID=UPI003803D1A6